MKLSDLVEIVLVESGEFIVTNSLDDLGMSDNQFWRIVKTILGTYDSYKPYTVTRNIQLSDYTYTFSASEPNGIPEWISQVIPVSSYDKVGVFLYYEAQRATGELSSLEPAPRTVLWKYEKPKLWVTEGDWFDVVCHYNHTYEILEGSTGDVEDMDFPTLSEKDDLFIKLVLGKFLKALGRSRRAFVLEDLPVTMDASDLVSEGDDIYKETLELLMNDQSDWYKAVGG